MTDLQPPSPLDSHTAAFRGELLRASRRVQRRRRGAIRSISIAIPAAAAATLAIALWPGADRVDPLERATAALSPRTGVVHFRAINGPIGMRQKVCAEDPVDIWLETRGDTERSPRWRYRTNSARCMTKGIEQALGHILTGREEVWFDGESRSNRGIDDGWVETLTDVPPSNTDRQLPDITQLTGAGNQDPLRTLRDLYTSGKVRPTGRSTIGARTVRLFQGPLDWTEADDQVRIAVDAETFAPVEVRVTMRETAELRQRKDDEALGYFVRFDAYDVATERDLAPTIPPGTETASVDYRAFRRQVLKAKAYPPKPISAEERARAADRLAARAGRP